MNAHFSANAQEAETCGPASPPSTVSLAWVEQQRAVPVCGGNLRQATRALWSLSANPEVITLPDGRVEFRILPISKGLQGAGAAGAFSALLGLPFGFWALAAGHENWMPWIFLAGALVGLAAAPRLVRHHPAVVFRLDRNRSILTADEAGLSIARHEVGRLVLVTGNKLVNLPGHPAAFAGSEENRNGALLAVKIGDPQGDRSILLYPYALPAPALGKIAAAVAKEWAVPLEKLKFA